MEARAALPMAEVPELDNLLDERVGLENRSERRPGCEARRLHVHALLVILDIMNSSISCKCLSKICKPLLVSRCDGGYLFPWLPRGSRYLQLP